MVGTRDLSVKRPSAKQIDADNAGLGLSRGAGATTVQAMLPSRQGAIRLFRVVGITVFLHWSWFLFGALIIQQRRVYYDSLLWNVLEYLTLFALVLMHEFGHALGCRQVGGRADEIVLWPLGGVAFVAPPPRPGAVLWSLAAGPLVNVALLPVFYALSLFAVSSGWYQNNPNGMQWLDAASFINRTLLIFNMLPIFPLDGGQILRALLWYGMGPVRSLLVATSIGFVGVAILVYLAWANRSIWIAIMAAFVFMNCRSAWLQAWEARKR